MSNVIHQPARKVYYQKSTSNKSFLNMHYYLKDTGVQNNKFMLALLDPDLAGIDPHDKRLNTFMKQKILRECIANFWYFIREVVRIPDPGGAGLGAKYELHRGNMALNFCMNLNLNIFLELPRQRYKTISAVSKYLHLFNFGTAYSEITFTHQKMSESKLNLQRLKDLRSMLPSYLQMNQSFTRDNKKQKIPDTIEKLQHPINHNIIKTSGQARNKVAASNLLRGRSITLWWLDEYAFIPFNDTIYSNTIPAFKTVSGKAKANGAPYGILITTTPGFLTTEEGKDAYEMKEDATKFNELWYDKTYNEIMQIIDANNRSNFVYIRFTYQQLGCTEEWFAEICKDMKYKWDDIRREVLLEWSFDSGNSPFRKEDLEAVGRLVREPWKTIYFLNKYPFNIYEEVERKGAYPKYSPLVGVDVSGGYKRDSSAITCVCSKTTRVFADFNCNYISPIDLAMVVYELVTKFMPNAVVNVERNGGFGASVLAKLIKSSIKKNLYYEIKDKIIEERNDGTRVVRKSQKTKVYGLDSTKTTRDLLMEILRERMNNHKDKFVSKTLYEELRGLEVKKSGKIEHSSNTHDDQVFSYLMAMYIWYEGKNLMETFGIEKATIKTDESVDEVLYGLEEKYGPITEAIENLESADEIKSQIQELESGKGKLHHEWVQEQIAKDNESLQAILATKIGREAYSRQFNTPIEDLQKGQYTLPDSVYSGFYNDDDEDVG